MRGVHLPHSLPETTGAAHTMKGSRKHVLFPPDIGKLRNLSKQSIPDKCYLFQEASSGNLHLIPAPCAVMMSLLRGRLPPELANALSRHSAYFFFLLTFH